MPIGEAASRTGWSARMLRYLERTGLVLPERTPSGYRTYGIRELNQLRSLRSIRDHFAIELAEVAFAARLRREPQLWRALDSWFAGSDPTLAGEPVPAWVEWEQRKHEQLLAA